MKTTLAIQRILTVLASTVLIFSSLVSAKTMAQKQIERQVYKASSYGTIAGNPKGTVTVVDFFDYYCMPCRIVTRTLNELVQKDKWLRVVYVDFPILEEQSSFAARAALAARYQHKYQAMHDAMMSTQELLNRGLIFRIARQEGLSLKTLQNDINSRKVTRDLQGNKQLAQAFGVQDLPTAIIGYTHAPHQTKVYFGSSLLHLENIVDDLHERR